MNGSMKSGLQIKSLKRWNKCIELNCRQTGVTELVGREEELELLLRRWSKAKTGEGQVVLLSGEPGIGKSRLTAALLERLAERAIHTFALLLLTAAHRQRPISHH
jgi:predicted ATP-dependent serine protease